MGSFLFTNVYWNMSNLYIFDISNIYVIYIYTSLCSNAIVVILSYECLLECVCKWNVFSYLQQPCLKAWSSTNILNGVHHMRNAFREQVCSSFKYRKVCLQKRMETASPNTYLSKQNMFHVTQMNTCITNTALLYVCLAKCSI